MRRAGAAASTVSACGDGAPSAARECVKPRVSVSALSLVRIFVRQNSSGKLPGSEPLRVSAQPSSAKDNMRARRAGISKWLTPLAPLSLPGWQPNGSKQDGQDGQDKAERMKDEGGRMKARQLLFHPSSFCIAFYPVHPVHPVNFFLSLKLNLYRDSGCGPTEALTSGREGK
jgi:hypothetical protein